MLTCCRRMLMLGCIFVAVMLALCVVLIPVKKDAIDWHAARAFRAQAELCCEEAAFRIGILVDEPYMQVSRACGSIVQASGPAYPQPFCSRACPSLSYSLFTRRGHRASASSGRILLQETASTSILYARKTIGFFCCRMLTRLTWFGHCDRQAHNNPCRRTISSIHITAPGPGLLLLLVAKSPTDRQ